MVGVTKIVVAWTDSNATVRDTAIVWRKIGAMFRARAAELMRIAAKWRDTVAVWRDLAVGFTDTGTVLSDTEAKSLKIAAKYLRRKDGTSGQITM